MPKDNDYIPALKYKGLTKFYDPLLRLYNVGQKLTDRLLAEAAVADGDVILDFGCGPGNLLIRLKQKIPQALCHGVDVDQRILKIAAEKIAKQGLAISLQHYDGRHLPYQSKTFDKVFSSLVFHHLSRQAKKKALQEIYRVLKPQGKLLILDFGRPANLLMRFLFLPVRLLDGFLPTKDNVLGRLPAIISEAGFVNAAEKGCFNTPVGTLCLYWGIKPKE